MINTNQTHSGLTPFKKGFAFMKILTQLRHLLLVCMLCGWSLGAAAIETVVYYHNDTAGSPVAATDGNGNLAWREHYRPYGDRVTKQPAGNNQLWFHNKPQDEQTGLSYVGARYYDPIVGRFMGVDPEHFDDDNLHSFNRYAYGNNNPYKFTDPDGKDAVGVVVQLLAKGGEKVVRWVSTKAEAVMARKQGETVVMQTKRQAKQIEEALNRGDKSNILRHKGHELRDGSTGLPHYQTEGKQGHSMWGKIFGGASAIGLGLGASDADASQVPSNGGGTGTAWRDVGDFVIDLLVPGGVGGAGQGSDIVPHRDQSTGVPVDK